MARSARRRRGGDVRVTMRAALSAIGSKSVAPAWKEASPSSRRSLLRWTSTDSPPRLGARPRIHGEGVVGRSRLLHGQTFLDHAQIAFPAARSLTPRSV